MGSDHINLPQAVHFGAHHPGQPRADVAVHASHLRVRGKVVGGIFWKHDVTGGPAEICRIQILHAAVGRGPNDEKIESGRQGHPLQGASHHGQAQINGRENYRQSPTSAQTSPPEPDAEWNQQQA